MNDLLIQITNKPTSDIFTCAIFKKEKIVDQKPSDLFGIEIPDVWICGYGIDDFQEKRGWVHLFAVPKYSDVIKTKDDELFINDDYYNKIRINILQQLKLF